MHWQNSFLYNFVLLIVLLTCSVSHCKDLPTTIIRCRYSDEKCILREANKFMKTYKNGDPALGIPRLEPLNIGDVHVVGNPQSPANIDLLLNNVEIHNYTNGEFKSLKGFSDDTTKPIKVLITLTVPQITLKAKYKISGNVLILPIRGEGDAELILKDVLSKTKITFKKVKIDDDQFYLKIDEYKFQTKYDDVQVDMTNLFNGDKVLSDNILKVLNENWRTLGDDLSPKIDETLRNKQKEIIDHIFYNVPYDKIFLPNEE